MATSRASFLRALSERPEKLRLELSSMIKIHTIPNYFNSTGKFYCYAVKTFGSPCNVNINKFKGIISYVKRSLN